MTTIWLSLGLALLVGCAWLFTATSARGMGRPPHAQPAVARPATNALTVADIKGLNREAIRAMLKRLATTRPPDVIRDGIMISCYYAVPSPTNTAYICPICGEKTLYTKERVGEVEDTIPSFRSEVKNIQALVGKAVTLDETMYCRRCRPQVTQPKLLLTIHFNDGTSRSLSQVTSSHLRELQAFLKGEIKLKNSFGDAEPLQQYLPHLETMLGEKATP